MSTASPMMNRFRQMPRAIQWAAIALVALAAFLAWDQYLGPVAERLNKEADVIEGQVRDVRAAAAVARDLQNPRFKGLVTSIGPVRVPVSMAEGSKMFNDVVIEVLQKHGATNDTLSSRPRGRLPKTALVTVAQGKRVDRLTGDLKFDARPESAIAIIADLESSPHIESVNTVRILRDTGGRVKVHLTIEAWLLVSDAGAGATL